MAYLGTVNEQQGAWNMADYAPAGLDALIAEGVATTDAAQRFAVYSDILRRLAADVPYVPLYLNDLNVALSQKFTVPGFNSYSMSGDYALNVKAAQ